MKNIQICHRSQNNICQSIFMHLSFLIPHFAMWNIKLTVNSFIIGTSNKTTDNTTNYHTAVCETKITKQEKLHSLMAAVIALTAVSFIICMIYIYTRVLEKHVDSLTLAPLCETNF